MASTNQSPQYQKAEVRFFSAQNLDDKIDALKEMIKECPKHKSSEKMLANLKTRLKKLQGQQERSKKSKGASKKGIKKEEMQAIIVGLTNSGKSTLISRLTNTSPEIANYDFTTKNPEVGMLNYQGTNIQLIENPAIESEYHDKGLTNSADVLLIIINSLEDLDKINPFLEKSGAKKIIAFNIKDDLNERKLDATLKSKKYNYVIMNLREKENLNELKEKLFQSFGKIRVFTKEPGKEKSPKPVILEPESTIKDIAEKILHGFSKKVKQVKIWGPSSKFSGQIVGLSHKLKDLDIVEFKTK